MPTAEDLTGKTFGYLKVIDRTENHVSRSGQTKVMWNCQCLLCGNKKAVAAAHLKGGAIISCGCWKAYKGKQSRNKKICIICGKEFETPPSNNKVTCSKECQKTYAKIRSTGRVFSAEARQKMSQKAKERDVAYLNALGTAAAKESPNSGRFETNVNAVDWHLISPEGKHYYFHSLHHWLRENCRKLFGCEPDSREFKNVRSGLSGARRAVLGKNYPCCTYKGWQSLPVENWPEDSNTSEIENHLNLNL